MRRRRLDSNRTSHDRLTLLAAALILAVIAAALACIPGTEASQVATHKPLRTSPMSSKLQSHALFRNEAAHLIAASSSAAPKGTDSDEEIPAAKGTSSSNSKSKAPTEKSAAKGKSKSTLRLRNSQSRSAIPTTSRKPPSELERSWRPVYYPHEHRGTIVWQAGSLRDCRFIMWKVYLTHGNGFCDGLPHTHPVTGGPLRSRCIAGYKRAAKKCRKSIFKGKTFVFSYEFDASDGAKLPTPRKVDGSPVPKRHVHIFNHDPSITDEDLDDFDDEEMLAS
ncbi:hypothetical protein HDU96_003270 [Phlyctochytrium bullatum]|nr:hypothetical protein HDU96_003270 [Phlyctochytrium bullatum]